MKKETEVFKLYKYRIKELHNLLQHTTEAEDIILEIKSFVYEHLKEKQIISTEALNKIFDNIVEESFIKYIKKNKGLKHSANRKGISILSYVALAVSIPLLVLKFAYPANVGVFIKDENIQAIGFISKVENYKEIGGNLSYVVVLIVIIISSYMLYRKNNKSVYYKTIYDKEIESILSRNA